MATNLLIGYPDYPFNAEIDTSHATTGESNLVTGSRGKRIEVTTATSDDLWINFDPGSPGRDTNFLAILRASLLPKDDVRTLAYRAASTNFLSGASPFTGLAGWYDSTRGITKNGSNQVTQWNDLSGNSRTATNGAASPPVWLVPASGVNGSGAIDFDTNVKLLFTGSGFTIAQPLTVILACKIDSHIAGRWLFAGAASPDVATIKDGTTNWELNAGSNADTGRAVSTGTKIISVIFNNTSSKFYEDGTQYGGSLSPGTQGLKGFAFGNNVSGTTIAFDGKLCEVMIYGSALSDADRGIVEGYLTAKWKTAAIVSNTAFNSETLVGPRNEDWITTFSNTGNVRDALIQLGCALSGSQPTSKYAHSKIYLGTFFDFGTDPTYPRAIERRTISARDREPRYFIQFTWKGVRNTTRQSFIDKIVKHKDINPVILYTASYHDVLNEHRLIHCWVRDVNISCEQYDVNTITVNFEEAI